MMEFVNFFNIFLCGLNGNIWVFAFLAIIVIIFLFKFMADVVDEYMTNSLIYFAKIFKMSEAFAGITLIAFANGAGDIFSSLASTN